MIPLHPRLMVALVTWSAQHNASVETVVREALRTYMEDVDLRLLPPPPEAKGYEARLRPSSEDVAKAHRQHSLVERLRRGK